jgi:hypothetical protein
MRRPHLLLALVLMLGISTSALAGGDGQPAAQASADVVTLKDGRKLEGRIVAEDDRFVSIESGGTTRAYPRDTIASIERAAKPPAGHDAGAATAPSGKPDAPSPGADVKRPKGDRKDAPLSEAAKAWLDALIAKSADGDETVRRSVAAAISALGRQAVPALRAAANAAPDGQQKQFLTRLADDMESRRDRKMRGDAAGPEAPMPAPDAPGRDGPGRRMLDGLMARLGAELELRDEQRPKVEAIIEKLLTDRFQLRRAAQAEGLTAEQVADKVTALRTDLLAQMKTILDEGQFALFEEMAPRILEAPKAPPPRPADGAGAPPPPPPGNDPPK